MSDLIAGNLAQPPPIAQDSMPELILGAGGVKFFYHIGVLRALRQLAIRYKAVLGVSCGALTGSFVVNGFGEEDLIEIFLDIVAARWQEPITTLRGLAVGCYNLQPFMAQLVSRYGLVAKPNLRLLACDSTYKTPVLFEGEYSLVKALTASCSVPRVFCPVPHRQSGREALLVDGAIWHYNPTQFSDDGSIVSTFSTASGYPSNWQTIADLYFHWREMYMPLAGDHRDVDRTKHIVIENGDPDVAALNFGLGRDRYMRMVDGAYKKALVVLRQAIAEGRLSPTPIS